ncbi:C40 family peptidase (plasmid) [Nocardia sp. CA-084685]|uniref:C40 family peptidase n=1 Tax=Nocardia sp. CA-084685 TaxID=3239970 RepID=UPI003D98DF3B
MAAAIAVPMLIITILVDNEATACAPVLGQGLPDTDGVSLAGLNTQQLAIAKLAVQVGEQRHIASNGIMAALMAASRESSFQNYANSNVPESLSFPHDAVGSDYDSVGPWQMRVSVWGKEVGVAGLMDPSYQANWFFNKLADIDGWESRDPGDLAALVENPRADLVGAYDAHRDTAAAIYSAFQGSEGSGGAYTPDYATCGPGAPAVDAPPGDFNARVLAAAQTWLGTDYVWGGGNYEGPSGGGFDCSGLVLYAVYQASGGAIQLPHYTQSQQDDPAGRPLDPGEQLEPGDIIFFTAPGKDDSHHVGIYAGNGQLLHAPETGQVVKVSSLADGWEGERQDIRRFGTASKTTKEAQ